MRAVADRSTTRARRVPTEHAHASTTRTTVHRWPAQTRARGADRPRVRYRAPGIATCGIRAYPRVPGYQVATPLTVSPSRSWAHSLAGRSAARTTARGADLVGAGSAAGAAGASAAGVGCGTRASVLRARASDGTAGREADSWESRATAVRVTTARAGSGLEAGADVLPSRAIAPAGAGRARPGGAASTPEGGVELTMTVTSVAATAARQRWVVVYRVGCLVGSRPARGGLRPVSRRAGAGLPCRGSPGGVRSDRAGRRLRRCGILTGSRQNPADTPCGAQARAGRRRQGAGRMPRRRVGCYGRQPWDLASDS